MNPKIVQHPMNPKKELNKINVILKEVSDLKAEALLNIKVLENKERELNQVKEKITKTYFLTSLSLEIVTDPKTKSRRAKHIFDNGYILSIVGGAGFYGDGLKDWELAILDKENNFVTKDLVNRISVNDVLGYQTEQEIEDVIIEVLHKIKPNKLIKL